MKIQFSTSFHLDALHHILSNGKVASIQKQEKKSEIMLLNIVLFMLEMENMHESNRICVTTKKKRRLHVINGIYSQDEKNVVSIFKPSFFYRF